MHSAGRRRVSRNHYGPGMKSEDSDVPSEVGVVLIKPDHGGTINGTKDWRVADPRPHRYTKIPGVTKAQRAEREVRRNDLARRARHVGDEVPELWTLACDMRDISADRYRPPCATAGGRDAIVDSEVLRSLLRELIER